MLREIKEDGLLLGREIKEDGLLLLREIKEDGLLLRREIKEDRLLLRREIKEDGLLLLRAIPSPASPQLFFPPCIEIEVCTVLQLRSEKPDIIMSVT